MMYRGKQNSDRLYAFLLIFCLFLFVSCQEEQEITQVEKVEFQAFESGTIVPGRYIVVLENNQIQYKKSGSYSEIQAAMRKEVNSFLASFRIDSHQLDRLYSSSIEGFSVILNESQKEILEKDSRVKFIEPDRIIALGPPPGKGPNKEDPENDDGGTSSETIPYGISRVGGPVTYTGNNKAYIIDTGIDLNHSDLNVNSSLGFNAFNNGRDSKDLNDNNGHGTHVAGTIAAKENGFGVVGVAAGAVVVPIKVLDQNGSGSYSGVIAGVDFVGANGNPGDVANMSLGGPPSNALDNAVIAAASEGVYFSLAAGNSAKDANDYSPARAEGNGIYTVSAMDVNDDFAYFSNFANPPVDWCAPGVGILSTWNDGGFNTISGTSMSAPHVAGIRLLGNISQDGTVKNDPDGEADPIASH